MSIPPSAESVLAERIAAIEKMLVERDRRYTERHESLQEATELAADILESRLQSMNEFRSQILQERGLFITREIHDAHLDQDRVEHDRADARVRAIEGIVKNYEGRFWMMGIVASFGGAVIGTLLSIVIRLMGK